jgi:hypothetical protein
MRSLPYVIVTLALLGMSGSARAADYYRHKWFDYPDPVTAPKFASRTGCAHWIKPWRGSKICTNPTHFQVKVALLRKDVVFVVSGPASPDQAIQRAVAGYAAGCAATAVTAAVTAAAATPSPEPAARIAAASGVLFSSFAGCISTVSAAGIAGGIVAQLHINIDTSGSHWSPL